MVREDILGGGDQDNILGAGQLSIVDWGSDEETDHGPAVEEI